ncbi:hypothetical protein NN6n1_08440 [Shinella zoogloeoides]
MARRSWLSSASGRRSTAAISARAAPASVERIEVLLGGDQRVAAADEEGARSRILGPRRGNRRKARRQGHDGDRPHLAKARPGRHRDRRLQKLQLGRIRREDGEGEALHVKRGHQRRGTDHMRDARAERGSEKVMRQHRHFEDGGAAEIVDQRHMRPLAHRGGKALRHDRDGAARAGKIDLLHARLAMDAEAELRLGLGNARLARRARHPAGAERQADGARRRRDPPCRRRNAFEIGPAFSQCPGDLVDEERAGDAARLRQVRQGDVVVDDDHGDVEPLRPRPLGGEAEVQAVAGIVFDDQQAAGRSRHGKDAGQHRIDARRGKDIAADRGRQHAAPDEARMGRLVARAATGDDRHLRPVPIAAQHHADMRIAVEAGKRAAGKRECPVDGLGDDVFAPVDELRHGKLPK